MVMQAIDDTVAAVADNVVAPVEAPPEITPPETAPAEATPEPAPEPAPEPVKPDYSSLLADAPEADLLATPKMRDILARREESIRRRTEETLKREASNNESVQQVLSGMLAKAVETGDDSEYRRLAGQALLWNQQYQMAEIAKQFPEALMRQYQLPVDVREKALAIREADPAQSNWDGYVTTLIEGAVEAKVTQARRDDEARVKQAIADGVAAELRAREIAARPKIDAPPTPPSGSPAGSNGQVTWDQIDKQYTDSQWMNLPAATRRQLSEQASRALTGS